MKIAIAARGPEGDEKLDSRFGRCEKFVFVDTDTGERTASINGGREMGGAGISAAQVVVDAGSDALIAPEVGPKAFRVLSGAGVEIYRSRGGSLEEILEELKKGNLEMTASATVAAHH